MNQSFIILFFNQQSEEDGKMLIRLRARSKFNIRERDSSH